MSCRPGVYRKVTGRTVVQRNNRINGELLALALECGHSAIRNASTAGERALCEVCTDDRRKAEAAAAKERRQRAPLPVDWRQALRTLVDAHGAEAVLEELAALESASPTPENAGVARV